MTAFGESAGSASLCFHLSSNVPLFNRVVLQSGTASSISPTPCSKKEEEYQALLAFCDIDKDDPQRLEKLREVPATKIVEATTVLMKGAFSPLAHESFFPIVPNYLNHDRIVADCPWVEAVMAGDAIYEVRLYARNVPLATSLTESRATSSHIISKQCPSKTFANMSKKSWERRRPRKYCKYMTYLQAWTPTCSGHSCAPSAAMSCSPVSAPSSLQHYFQWNWSNCE